MKKRNYIIACIAVLVILVGWIVWNRTGSVTRIALINFQQFQTTSIVKANQNRFVKYKEVAPGDFGKLGRYDLVLGFGMGMRITADERSLIQRAADRGTPTLIYAATNPDNNICTLDSVQLTGVQSYLGSGNRRNYENLALSIRREIDGKRLFAPRPEPPVESAYDVIYHLDDEKWFENAADYEKYLKEIGHYTAGGAKIAMLGGLNDPFSGNRANIDSMIVSFERAGMNIYPILSFIKRLDFLREIEPDAVIYFAHGRLNMGRPDEAVEWLKERNIPIFSPLSILQTRDEWEADPMGMFGGFMSQSLVMPELDGAIYPYVVNAQMIDDEGLSVFAAIPDRLRDFTRIVKNFTRLKHRPNSEKKVAIYYFKGAGQETLAAQGLETVPSLYNLLKALRTEGYRVDGLPATAEAFEELIMSQGAVLSPYAQGAFDDYLKSGNPAFVEKSEYESWIAEAMPEELYADVVDVYGAAPGSYMSVERDGKQYLAVARIELGNIALLPQPMAAVGDDSFAIVHGAKTAPPHTYIAAYLWAEKGFGADAIVHFGTHGSLEFTPSKQVALSSRDWPDRLVGTTPHFYYYTIANVGESMMAKRRSYATLISYLNPPFMESGMRGEYKKLEQAFNDYWKTAEEDRALASLKVKKLAVEMGLHRELRMDSVLLNPWSEENIERVENFAEEIATEKMTGQLYTAGIPYEDTKIRSTVMAMSADPIAYSVAALDKLGGKLTEEQFKNKGLFNRTYLAKTQVLVNDILSGREADRALICSVAGISESELAQAHAIASVRPKPTALRERPKAEDEEAKSGGHPAWIPKVGKKPEDVGEKNGSARKSENKAGKATGERKQNTTTGKTEKADEPPSTSAMPAAMAAAMGEGSADCTPEQKQRARAILEIERTILNVLNYKEALEESPRGELRSVVNALNGGYVSPSSGGDAVANPHTLPTGRNLYAVNAEATPSESAWDKGVSLVGAMLDRYMSDHGEYPRKVSYTFWSSEFIETEGATIAQVLYMLGVEPVRDAFGRVSDIQLIPSAELGRPRIDVVVQTSGQFRDLAASRLALISRAVEMAASATGDQYDNYVSGSTVEIERQLVDQGVPPRDAREMSTQRVFGGVNGMYGTGIQGMVKSGDRWESESEIADTYINNVGAVYGGDKDWGEFHAGLLRAVLHSTDVVVQPRQSNTWGALSLDHVFEFMGGMNLAVREVTGKDPEAYFADYRNRNNVRMQELKEAIGVESRSTLFNPNYIREVMKGEASSAAQITEVVTNMYGWNVMKPDVIDNEMWDGVYDVYVKDKFELGVQEFYRRENPAAMQEITAVMLETARKGMWQATEQQLSDIARLHTELVRDFGPTGAGFAGNNLKLQDFIARKAPQQAAAYRQSIEKMQQSTDLDASNAMVLKRETRGDEGERMSLNGALIIGIVVVAFVGLLIILRRKRR